jgi:hypothetical protein
VLDQSGNLTTASGIESESGGFVLPDGTTLNEGSDLEGLPTNDNGASLVDNINGFLATGAFNSGSIPTEGTGTRMMWYPEKAAFRAGRVGEFKDGTQWNAAKVGDYSVAFGLDTKASGNAATAIGDQTTASGEEATAMGVQTTASGEEATAMGQETTASGNRATAMGFQTTASGPGATAMGVQTTASGFFAMATGEETTASDESATAMGRSTTASGFIATAMGDNTIASGNTATAMGAFTTASGNDATAMGTGTTAATSQSLSIGICNDANSVDVGDGTLFAVGNGNFDFANKNCNSRSDAFTVDEFGSATAVSHDTFSDRRLKTAVEPLRGNTLTKLAELRPVRYEFKDQQTHPAGEQLGLIAQDVQKEFPSLVREGSGDYLSLAYPKLTAVLVKGLQEQQAQIDRQQAQLDAKDRRIAELEAENEAIKERLAALEAKVSSGGPAVAGLAGPWGLGLLLGLGGLGAGLLWRRRA